MRSMEFVSCNLILLLTLIFANFCLISTTDSPTTSSVPCPPPSNSPLPSPSTPFPPSPPLSPPSTPLPQPTTTHASPPDMKEKQLRNIMDAIMSSGDFDGFVNFLDSSNEVMLPLTATLFIPENTSLPPLLQATAAGLSIDPLIIPYHIIPQHLTFSDLQQFPVYSRVLTLLSSNFIIITNVSSSNFTVDDSVVTHPDMYTTTTIAVHGVSKILDYKVYGTAKITFTEEEGDEGNGILPPKGMNLGDHNGTDESRDFKPEAGGSDHLSGQVQHRLHPLIFVLTFLVLGIV